MPADLLFERERSLEALQAVLVAARAGTGRAALVTGAPGIGKTRLLGALMAEASAGGVVCLSATGHTMEQDYGFGVVRALFAQLPEALRDELVDEGGRASADAPAGALFALLDALLDALTRAAAQRPLLVVVDDLQWVDEPSLRFLHFLARRLSGTGIGLVLAVRSGQQHGSILAELGHTVSGTEVALGPLTRDAVGAVLRERLGDVAEVFIDACMTWTRGNPLFLSELSATMATEGIEPTADGAARLAELAPGTIGRLVFVRIARAGDAAVSLAQAVAVLGDAPTVAAAARLADLSVAAAGEAAVALIGLDILDQSLAFTHPVVREAVYDDLAAPLRATRHFAAAEVLHELSAPVEAIAAQLLLAPAVDAPWVRPALQRAARAAVARGAPDAAARFLGRALGADAERADAADVATLGGIDAHGSGDQAQVALDVTRTHLLWIAGRSTAAIELADRTVDVRSGEDSRPDAMLAMKLMLQCVTPGAERPSPELLDRFASLTGQTQVERDCLLPVILYRLARGTPAAEIRPLIAKVTSGQNTHSAKRRSPATWLFLLLHLGDLDRTLDFVDRYRAAAEDTDSPMWRAEALTVRSQTLYRLGRIAEAEHDANEALAITDGTFALTGPVAAATLMQSRLELGDQAGAIAAAEGFKFPSQREDTAFAALAEAATGRVRTRTGDPEGGLSLLRSAGEKLDSVEWIITELSPWRIDAAQALVGLGRKDEAIETIAPAYDAAVRFGAPNGLGRVLRVRALLEEPVSIDLLREAVAVYDDGGLPLKRAHALVELGAALRRAGHRTDAREPLAEAMDLAHRCGARPLVDRATDELTAAGSRPRTTARTGVEALTASELRVARLAASGLRNADIARELFVQPTTVEKHLASVFRKLGIESRTDLPTL
ncbi:LuxR family transcriptional regulator [Nocardioides sp. WS12]|uniref:AAA family ATPase n=1 Tax=Nocardioides sp. WS12 TaxID=2486272 RepID=UPI0015F7CDD2|nr:LuxR family transcriptional regulator [Nocardioides sp. WS12]